MLNRKLKELDNFQGYQLNILNKQINFYIKPISINKRKYILNNLKQFLENDDNYKTLLNDLIDIKEEDLNIILNNQQASEYLFEKIFKEPDININFENLLLERLEQLNKSSKEMINLFISYLISYGYKLKELEELTHIEIVDLCIKESFIRNKEEFLKSLLEECKSNNSKDRYPKLKEFILENYKDEIKSFNKANSKKESDYDQLARL